MDDRDRWLLNKEMNRNSPRNQDNGTSAPQNFLEISGNKTNNSEYENPNNVFVQNVQKIFKIGQ